MNTSAILSSRDIDGRRRAARRIKALVREFSDALGGQPAPHQVILIRSAAELTAVAEATRAQLLAGGAVSSNDLVRIQNAMQRAIDALNLPVAPIQSEDLGTLMQRLAMPEEAADQSDPADSSERMGNDLQPVGSAL